MAHNGEEEPIFQRSGVTLTRTRFTTSPPVSDGTETYYLQGLTSVSHRLVSPNTKTPWSFIFYGIVLIVVSVVSFTKELLAELMLKLMDSAAFIGPFLMWPAIIGLGILAIGVIWLISLKDYHHLVLGSASGETSALMTYNGQFIEELKQELDKVMIARGS